MRTAQEIQMERTDIPRDGSKSALYQSVQLSFTPSFFSHGWELSLSPIYEYPNSYLETPGNLLISFKNLQTNITKLTRLFEVKIFPSMSTIVRLFL